VRKQKLYLVKIRIMKKTPKSTPKTSSSKVEEKALFLINDDYNTFDHVIDCLVAICDHDEIQAEQCAVLVHYKGSCEIAIGKEADNPFTRRFISLRIRCRNTLRN